MLPLEKCIAGRTLPIRHLRLIVFLAHKLCGIGKDPQPRTSDITGALIPNQLLKAVL